MAQADRKHINDSTTSPVITIPRRRPATPEEVIVRRALCEEAARLRDLIGPVGMTSAEFVRQVRDEG